MTENPHDIKKLKALTEISLELEKATKTFPPFRSYHEGYAIIKEELDELWESIKARKPSTQYIEHQADTHIKKEAIQLAAMATRFIIDLCEG